MSIQFSVLSMGCRSEDPTIHIKGSLPFQILVLSTWVQFKKVHGFELVSCDLQDGACLYLGKAVKKGHTEGQYRGRCSYKWGRSRIGCIGCYSRLWSGLITCSLVA